MTINARVLGALEQEVQDAVNLDSATYDDLTAAQISLAISHAKLHTNVNTTIAPAVTAQSDATVKTANTQAPTSVAFPTKPKTSDGGSLA